MSKNSTCKKQCKECPWKKENSNQHNNMITEFSNKHNKKHNCHMIDPKLWDIKNEKNVCRNFSN